ncbi:MAG: MBL fold metallo-hydrolase [Methylococcaceae bacterium]|jgi:glyoxylase-like metal-dependent hydrolase (beta-lactamase superfamily II)
MQYRIIPVTTYQQNCTLLICNQSRKAAVVDPGGDIELILEHVAGENVQLESILLTHGHLDHIGAAAVLASQLGIPILGPHPDDQFWMDAIPMQCQMFNFPIIGAFLPTRWLYQGDTVKVGLAELDVLHCPGHTPGHVVFLHKASKLALVGDVLFKGTIGRTDFPKGDYNCLINSIQQNLWPLGKDIAFIPGHGPMSTFGEEMRSNPFVKV